VDQCDVIFEKLPTVRKALRIAIVTETYPPEVNGVAMTISRMIRGLQERGHHIQLIRLRQGAQDQAANGSHFQEVLRHGIPVPRYDSLRMGLPAKQALVRLWLGNRPDIAHIVTEGPLGWSALSAAAQLKIPCSSDFHTNFHSYSAHYGFGYLCKPIAAYLRKFHNRTQITFVPTESLRHELETLNFRNVQVVSRGIDATLFHPHKRSSALRERWGIQPAQLAVLYVGRLAPEKNLPIVIQAFAAIHAQRPDARLVLVGDGPERAALQANNPDAVFAGLRLGEDLAAHYASGDIFLFPSVTETFGNVTVEAMASGLAVLAYDYAAAAEYIEHGQSGLLARFDHSEEYIKLAKELGNDPGRVRRLGRCAREKSECLDWHFVNDAFESALANVVTGFRSDSLAEANEADH
jgi:glycosyltransferase involved in cell wall biosynthesis